MMFIKPNYFEVTLANFKRNKFQDEVLILTITEDYKVIEHAPIDLFFYTRNRAIITGFSRDDDWVEKSSMSIRTKKQMYAGWDPILTIEDLKRMIQRKITSELAKKVVFENEPKNYPFWSAYVGEQK